MLTPLSNAKCMNRWDALGKWPNGQCFGQCRMQDECSGDTIKSWTVLVLFTVILLFWLLVLLMNSFGLYHFTWTLCAVICSLLWCKDCGWVGIESNKECKILGWELQISPLFSFASAVNTPMGRGYSNCKKFWCPIETIYALEARVACYDSSTRTAKNELICLLDLWHVGIKSWHSKIVVQAF